MNESEYVDKFVKIFSKSFAVQQEVWDDTGKNRIDIVLRHHSNCYFGIECKKFESKRGQEMGEWVRQAVRYSKSKFEVSKGRFEIIPILLCPAISINYFTLNDEVRIIPTSEPGQIDRDKYWYRDRHSPDSEHHSFNGFIGAWGVGEVRKVKTYYKGSMKQDYIFSWNNKPVYSNIKGMHPKWYTMWLEQIKNLQ